MKNDTLFKRIHPLSIKPTPRPLSHGAGGVCIGAYSMGTPAEVILWPTSCENIHWKLCPIAPVEDTGAQLTKEAPELYFAVCRQWPKVAPCKRFNQKQQALLCVSLHISVGKDIASAV